MLSPLTLAAPVTKQSRLFKALTAAAVKLRTVQAESTAPATPRFITVAIVVLCVALIILSFVALIASTQFGFGVFGWNVGADGATIISVSPNLPAANAGIRPGDKIDFASLPLIGRVNLEVPEAVAIGDKLTVNVLNGGNRRTVTLRAVPQVGSQLSSIAVFISGVLISALGIWLVFMRPGRMTWGFLAIGIAAAATSVAYPWSTPDIFFLTSISLLVGNAITFAGLLIFVSRFPGDNPSGWLRTLDRAAIPIGCVYLAMTVYFAADILVGSSPPPYVVGLIADYIFPALVGIVALVALASSLAAARGSARQRLLPVISTFALYVALDAGGIVVNTIYTNPIANALIPILASLSLSLFAVAVAYGTIRHRVIDVGFVASRTLVYTILTAILVGVFALIDFFISKWLERTQLAFVVEIVVAVTIGFSLNTMHGRVDHFVDSVLFRRRHLAEKRLARVARMLPHAPSVDFVDETLSADPESALELSSSAVFRRQGNGSFRRRFALGWDGSTESLEASDHLVVLLQAELEPVRLSDVRYARPDMPTGLQQPLLAVPIVIRHEVAAIALYGGHVGGEALDPDEIRSLRELAMPAGAAYDHLEAETLRQQLEELRESNAELRRDRDAQASALDIVRQQMTAIDALVQQRANPNL
ncbi:MAG TPA: hypothetical protein VKT51_08210 [Candidatus Eremiobacteraceae bacterium]|nr:hypothetical protein [Candidatus Eremiobacteraceae bacterium]